MRFSPCSGSEHCNEVGNRCKSCGRSVQEIDQTRQLIDAVAQYAAKMGYENVEQFTQFLALKAATKARALRAEAARLKEV